MTALYDKNLSALQIKNPLLCDQLKAVQTNSVFEVFAGEDLSNANVMDSIDNTFLYELEPIKEIEKKLSEFQQFAWHKYLYFFGIGNGYFLKKLLENRNFKKVFVAEPEIELIYVALNLIDFSEEIKNNRIVILLTNDINFAYMLEYIDFSANLYFKTYNLFVMTPFYEKYQDKLLATNQTFIRVFRHFLNIIGNDCFDELTGLEQFLTNIPKMASTPSLKEMVSKSMITDLAIIVATGPSLYKQLPLLKEIQNRVTIISVDASLPILEKQGIKPDIVTSIERVKATAKFYKNSSKEFQKGIIFAITAVAHKELIDSIQKGTLQLSMRPTGSYYRFFQFDDWGYVGKGLSAANMAYEIASMIGFKRIVLIGQDLAFGEDGNSHSKGHIFGETEVNNKEGVEYTEAYGGKGEVETTKVWKLFLNGLEQEIARNNETKKSETINATQGGARIHGSIEMSFEEVVKNYLYNSKTKSKIVLQKPNKSEIEKNLKKISEKLNIAIDIGKSMQKRVKKLLIKVTNEIKKYKNINIDEIYDYIDIKDVYKMIEELKKIRKKYYGETFQSFYTYLISPILTHVEFDLATIDTLPENNDKEKVIKNWKTILVHHEWLLRVFSNLEKIIKILESKKEELRS
ncbi:MAG: motility associated factor glycosyltransferase family protein [Epsilonproteobacteria bacterium]|nr:motility associated factor glycosyltransferase family protein [Campylobacterota bacterium]